ncbi:MAG: tripartite tricarboxylate transporter substrate binding protein [Rubrivivax sp.]
MARQIQGRRWFGLLLSALCAAASADTYPSRPIQMIVPFPAGGVTDLGARLVAKALSERLKQPVVVDNRAGASGRIGTEAAARAQPDGYMLLYGLSVTHGMLMASTHKPNYDPVQSFTPIAPLFWYGPVLICNPAVPAKNVAELVAHAKRQPDGLRYASAGIGSGVHFTMEHFAALAGIKTLHVPYRGGAPALQAVIGGQVDCTIDGAAKPHVQSGAVRAIASTGAKRDAMFPDVPTLAEAGIAGFDMTIWQALFAPAGLPPEIAARLREAVKQAVAAPGFAEQALSYGLNPMPGSAADLEKMIGAEVAKYQALAHRFQISFE